MKHWTRSAFYFSRTALLLLAWTALAQKDSPPRYALATLYRLLRARRSAEKNSTFRPRLATVLLW